ncbi:MAG: hypothetical protein QOD66_2772 [Solirubrobacteraceae bacterium]|jgi:hypothetical protein|nr:hypothetical protein [Solirubrobacteraceae bacterium]
MADYVKFRLAAAKTGVSMALLALVGGAVERAEANPAATPARAGGLFLKLSGIPGDVKTALFKLEDKWIKLNSGLTKFEAKVNRNYYDKATINKTYLKIRDANAGFLKIRDANFLSAGGTAANSQKLGGLTPDAFVQGRGGIVSGALSTVAPTPQMLVAMGDGSVRVMVSATADPAGAPSTTLTLHNATGALIPAVQVTNGTPTSVDLKPGADTQLLGNFAGVHEVQVQLFPNQSGFNNVVTILISLEPSPTNQGQSAVGQMLIGLL